ncbi:conserved hypothetical protein [uncultured Pleomorphomonas sp.]|uniref:RES domain-containing protein n=1 Tax=uncultured Pleomorphomonas sp. TaxID=442121 RepID=A0A212L3X5_9HYPH|nr:RES family NAD+ phosphorylase [uncultured Pleomorphomonas sp.]SCM72273.1 conserved hypothetical protein [uncultured Pleomorphomonas sp.]
MIQFHPRDNRLLDVLEALPVVPFEGTVWRVVREGRSPCIGSAAGNRWDTGTFDVLYTSLTKEGAIAEIYYHLVQGQPVFPSKLRYNAHQIDVKLNGIYDLSDRKILESLGVNMSLYGQMSFLDRKGEYTACQRIAEAAHFLGSKDAGEASGIIVPNARYRCTNLVIFCEYVAPDALEEICEEPVVWP